MTYLHIHIFDKLNTYHFVEHKNIRAFVTHGGLGSLQESLSTGVPLIGIPLFGDQRINLLSQVSRKTAVLIEIDNIDATTFLSAVQEVLNRPVYK